MRNRYERLMAEVSGVDGRIVLVVAVVIVTVTLVELGGPDMAPLLVAFR